LVPLSLLEALELHEDETTAQDSVMAYSSAAVGLLDSRAAGFDAAPALFDHHHAHTIRQAFRVLSRRLYNFVNSYKALRTFTPAALGLVLSADTIFGQHSLRSDRQQHYPTSAGARSAVVALVLSYAAETGATLRIAYDQNQHTNIVRIR
jgi:hypothetical protein